MSNSQVAEVYAGKVDVGFVCEWQPVRAQIGGEKDFGASNGLGNIQYEMVAALIVVVVESAHILY